MTCNMTRHVVGCGVGFVASFVLALIGNNLVQDLMLFGGSRTGYYGSWLDWAGFWGLMMTVVFLPTTFLFGGSFALSVFKYPTIPGKVWLRFCEFVKYTHTRLTN
jgi:hypothetical protein